MGSQTSSLFSFLDAGGAPLTAPLEWAPATVLVPLSPDDLADARLSLQGTALPPVIGVVDGEPRALAQLPRLDTGSYRLVLDVRQEILAEQIITIRPQKISEDAYVALVNDLQGDSLPTSIALALERTGGFAGINLQAVVDTTVAQELSRLRRAIEGTASRIGLARALVEIARDPYRVLRKTERWVTAEDARRLEPVGLVQALRKPENLDLDTRRPKLVPDTRVEHTFDVYENRLVRLFLDQVERRLRRLGAVLEGNNQLAGVEEVEKLTQQLRISARAATFLSEVPLPGYIPMRATMVLLRRPLYRDVFESFLEFHRDAYVQLDHPGLDAPLDNLPDIYETWGALQAIAAVLAAGEELGFETKLQRIARNAGNSVFIKVLPDGQPALVLSHPDDDRTITVTPQRSFSRTTKPFRSMSFAQRPDLTVEITGTDRGRSLIVFDPKYKLRSEDMTSTPADDSLEGPPGQPKKVDIDKMHAYRDAVRDAEFEPAIRYAAILYPGPTTHYEFGVAALSALPNSSLALRAHLKEVIAHFAGSATGTSLLNALGSLDVGD